MSFFVYYLFDLRTSELLYVGRSTEPARRKWVFEKRTGIETELGECQRFTDLAHASAAEVRAILKHRPPHNKIVSSAPGFQGGHHSRETREHLRQVATGRPHSEATRAIISAKAMGHKRGVGHKHSAETRAKIGATRSATARRMKQCLTEKALANDC